jgi:putative flippase GtrA
MLYALVGILSSTVDLGGFWLFSKLGFTILVSSAASFSLATGINFVLCRRYVFKPAKNNQLNQLLRLFSVSIVGLLLNTFVVYLLVTFLSTFPIIAKIFAIAVVFIWNFLGRKIFVFKNNV